MNDTWTSVAPKLRTVLRSSSRPANRQRVALYEPTKALFSRPVAPFLDVLVVIDSPLTRSFVRVEQVKQWDVDADLLIRQGLSNLDPSDGLQPHKTVDGLWGLFPSDAYAAARMLMPGWLEAFRDRCVGEPVVGAPVAGAVYVADSAKPKALQELVEQCWELYSKNENAISPVPYVKHSDSTFRPWAPEGEHPLHVALSRAFLYLAGNEYAAQHGLLSEWAASQEPAPFIAPFYMIKRKGVMGGLTVLPDRPSLLPMATWVRQGTDDPKDSAPLVPWDELVREGIIEQVESSWNPPRWMVNRSH